jgi:hypothetical protein
MRRRHRKSSGWEGAAVNQQKDIIFDGTMTWAPFMEQTIAMVRDHKHNYKRGPGYHMNSRGDIIERCIIPAPLSSPLGF